MPVALELSALDVSLDGRVALITGGTQGIGLATAVELVKRGCTVVITSRTRKGGEAGARKIQKLTGKGPEVVDSLPLVANGPLKDLDVFANEFASKWSRLDILIFNAGHTDFSDEKTSDGHSRIFVERLAYQHVLTSRFWQLLKDSGTANLPSRVITTTGFAYKLSKYQPLEWLDLIENAGVEGQRLDFPASCIAQVGWTMCLGQACKDTETPVLFLLTHPGFVTGTGIATGCKQACIFPILSCVIGSHRAAGACLSNVAASVVVEPLPPQGGFIGPMKTYYGPPGVICLDQEDDKRDWQLFSCNDSVWKIGKIAIYELVVKTDSRQLEDFCENAKLFEERYRAYEKKEEEESSWCSIL